MVLNKEVIICQKALDITNQTFHSLTAIHKEPSRNGKTCWLFKCECGKEVVLQTQHVVNGATKVVAVKHSRTKIQKHCEICGEPFEIETFSQVNENIVLNVAYHQKPHHKNSGYAKQINSRPWRLFSKSAINVLRHWNFITATQY